MSAKHHRSRRARRETPKRASSPKSAAPTPEPQPADECPEALALAAALPPESFYEGGQTIKERVELKKFFDSLEQASLSGEIQVVRTLFRRVLILSERATSLDEGVTVLNSVGCAAIRIARLLKENRSLAENSSEVEEALTLALREIRAEFGLT